MKTIDARGLSCPEPVILTETAIKKGLPVSILVDCRTAVQNITRMVEGRKLKITVNNTADGEYELVIE